jgi:pimeloyl-ACP methyl ester carboxylesterase
MAASTAFPRFKSEEGQARYLAAYDAVVKQWPAACEELHLLTRLGPTHVIASGGAPGAPPLVLLPSFAGTATVWRPNVAALSQHFRTYAIDVIGQPGKSRAERRLRTRRDYADWLVDVLDGLGVARAAFVGCSFGGFLALSQASLTPDRVSKVVMISPAGVFVGLSWRFTFVMRTARLRRWIRRLLGDKRPPDLADLRGRAVKFDPADAGWRALMGVTMAESPEVSVINAAVFSQRELRAIRAPTLLLIGDGERLYDPQATLALAKRRMPALKGEIVPGANHIAAMAQPEAVNREILAFLTDAP